MMGFGDWGMMGLGMASMWLVWIGVIVLVVWVAVGQSAGRGKTEENSALDILKQRYAKGEITLDEYRTAKENLA